MRIESGYMPHFAARDAPVCKKRNSLNYNINLRKFRFWEAKPRFFFLRLFYSQARRERKRQCFQLVIDFAPLPLPSWTGTKNPPISMLCASGLCFVPKRGGHSRFPLPAGKQNSAGRRKPMFSNLYRFQMLPVPESGGNEKANDFKGYRFPTHPPPYGGGCVCACGDTHTHPSGRRCGFRLVAETRRTTCPI